MILDVSSREPHSISVHHYPNFWFFKQSVGIYFNILVFVSVDISLGMIIFYGKHLKLLKKFSTSSGRVIILKETL